MKYSKIISSDFCSNILRKFLVNACEASNCITKIQCPLESLDRNNIITHEVLRK